MVGTLCQRKVHRQLAASKHGKLSEGCPFSDKVGIPHDVGATAFSFWPGNIKGQIRRREIPSVLILFALFKLSPMYRFLDNLHLNSYNIELRSNSYIQAASKYFRSHSNQGCRLRMTWTLAVPNMRVKVNACTTVLGIQTLGRLR